MTSPETLPEPQISPRTQRILDKHKLYEAKSSQWNYLAFKPNPEDHPHYTLCRTTDLEWNYDIDRYSRHLWSHQKDRHRNSSNTGNKTSRTPTKFNNSPMKASPVRRARSTSIGEIRDFSPLRKSITFQPDAQQIENNVDQPSDSYHTPRNRKQGILTPRSEKTVLEQLYQLYKNSKTHENNSARPVDSRTRTSPYQTPEKSKFALSPGQPDERVDTSKSPSQWNNQEQGQQNEYRIDLEKRDYRNIESFYNQDFESRVSQDTKRSEVRSETEQGSQSQQTGRRSRNDRKKLKEEKMDVTPNPYNSVQQESENSLTSRALESISEINEEKPTMSSQEEKVVKERRSRKDRLKRKDLSEKEENQSTDEFNHVQRLAQGTLGNKYSESNVEFETEKFQNSSFAGSVNTDAFESRNKEKHTESQNIYYGMTKGNILNSSDREQEGSSNYFSLPNQTSQTGNQDSNFYSQNRVSPEKTYLSKEIKGNRDIEEIQEDKNKSFSAKKRFGLKLEKAGPEDYDTTDQYSTAQKNALDSIKVDNKSASSEESPKSHNKNGKLNAGDSENPEQIQNKKDFLNPYKGKGFSGYRLPISESRSFIDTEKDDGRSSTIKEDFKEDDLNNSKAMPRRLSNYGFDSSRQMIALPLELSQNEYNPSEEEIEREEQHDENDAYERIMKRLIDQSDRDQSSNEISRNHESSQELRNFIEIENQLFSTKANEISKQSFSNLLKPETEAHLDETQTKVIQEGVYPDESKDVARNLLDSFNKKWNASSLRSDEKSPTEEEKIVYFERNTQPEEKDKHHRMLENENTNLELQKSSPSKVQKSGTVKMKRNVNLKSLELNEGSLDGEEENHGVSISERIKNLDKGSHQEEAGTQSPDQEAFDEEEGSEISSKDDYVNQREGRTQKDKKIEDNKYGRERAEKSRENKDKQFEQILRDILPLAESFRQSESAKISNTRAPQNKEEKQKKLISAQENDEKQIIEVRPQRKGKDKATIFDTNITWEKLQLFRKVEQKAATKIQDFYSKSPKQMAKLQHNKGFESGKNLSKDEFLALIETMKKHEDLYHKMKGLVNEKGDDVVNLSIAFISAYCSLKPAGQSKI